jgi:ribosomal protein S18 acetylase RimI-like enzyme
VTDTQVRPYREEDRQSVRRICFETGFMGEPVEWLWRDQPSFADMFCGWWVDRRPQSALVAELEGEVAGYLLGCEDSRLPVGEAIVLLRHFVGRACAVRPGTAGVMWRMLGDAPRDAVRGKLPPTRYWDERWPAHLHIDLLPACRGRGVGGRLMGDWLASLRQRGIPGCHLQTMAENTNAVAFFETMGFVRHGEPDNAPGFRTRRGERLHVQLMVHEFD